MDDWPPPKARVRAALWETEGHLERREYFAATRTLSRVFGLAREAEGRLRGRHHLAAAGYIAQCGDAPGASSTTPAAGSLPTPTPLRSSSLSSATSRRRVGAWTRVGGTARR